MAVHLKLILRKEAVLGCATTYVRTGNREVQSCRRTFQEISKCISGEGWLKDKTSEIIRGERRREALEVEVSHSANIQPTFQSMFAEGEGHIVAELGRLRLRDARLVSANRCKAGTSAEVERRKCTGRRMLADVHAGKVKLIQRC